MKAKNISIHEQNSLGRLKQFAVKNSKKTQSTNNLAVIYNRCSSEKQDSIEWQDDACEQLCKQKKFDVRKTWSEKTSATTDDREAFQEMFEYVHKNNICHIVIYSYSRFSRTGDFELLKKLKKNGIKIHAVSQPVDDVTPTGRFTEKLFILFGQYDNDLRQETILAGMKNKINKGERISKVPIGYEKLWVNGVQKDPAEKKQTFISKDGKLIKHAFEWAEMNISQKEIIHRLNNMGLELSAARLSRILRNPFYCGKMTSSLLEEGEIIDGKHVPLISLETFVRVNEILDGKNPHGWKMKKENDEMPLKVFVKCGCCGRSLSAYPQKAIYYYYKCPNTGCKVNIKNTILHSIFLKKLEQFRVDLNIVPALKEQLMVTYWQLHDSESAREKPLKDELIRLQNELDKIEFNYATSVITFELYSKFTPIHKRRIADIEKELEGLSQNCANLESYIDSALNNTNNLLNIWHLLNYAGKQRLQYLVFPEGMTFFKTEMTLRTDILNPIFQAITCFSSTSKAFEEPVIAGDEDRSNNLYIPFVSANFLYNTFKDYYDGFQGLSFYNSNLWGSMRLTQVNPFTGGTKTTDFTYMSEIAGFTLSGTPIINSSSEASSVKLTLMGSNYSGNTTSCAINAAYVFTGLNNGSYSLYSCFEDKSKAYTNFHNLILSANTIYNPVLTK